eukprot:m.462958 g.462958  ORF g.462958 m.462958 type:complete len:189 (+) comp21606_c0_seq2:62-628(+)
MTNRHCFVTNVLPGKMEEYRHYHDNIYPEVASGLRAAGITQLTIFQAPGSNTIVMYITTAGPIDLGAATGPGSRYRLNARCREWEELMDADFHGGWTEMEEIHSSDKQWNTSLNAKMAEPEPNGTADSSAAAQPVSPGHRINQSYLRGGTMHNQLSRYEGPSNDRPKSPHTGRRGIQPPGGVTQIRFG